jgi:molybdate transport repressor ModE-like protein
MVNLQQMATLLAVVHTGSFREAAKQCGLSQPAVSQHIRRLEQIFKVRLIERSNAGCQPTQDANALIPYAKSLLKLAERTMSVLQRPGIVIGASSNIGIYLLQPYVKTYLDHHSHSHDVDLVIDRNPVIADKLQSGEIDVAVMEWWDNRPGFTAQLWRSEELVVIVPPHHPWHKLPCIPKRLLNGSKLLGGEPGTGTGRLLKQHFGEHAKNLHISMQLGSTEAVKQWVKAGLGVSLVLAGTVAQEHKTGALRAIPIEGQPLKKNLFAVWNNALLPDSLPLQFVRILTGSCAN